MSNVIKLVQEGVSDEGFFPNTWINNENSILQVSNSGNGVVLTSLSSISNQISNLLPIPSIGNISLGDIPIASGNTDPYFIDSNINISNGNILGISGIYETSGNSGYTIINGISLSQLSEDSITRKIDFNQNDTGSSIITYVNNTIAIKSSLVGLDASNGVVINTNSDCSITISIDSNGSSYPLILPSSQGNVDQVLINDGTGLLEWSETTPNFFIVPWELFDYFSSNAPWFGATSLGNTTVTLLQRDYGTRNIYIPSAGTWRISFTYYQGNHGTLSITINGVLTTVDLYTGATPSNFHTWEQVLPKGIISFNLDVNSKNVSSTSYAIFLGNGSGFSFTKV